MSSISRSRLSQLRDLHGIQGRHAHVHAHRLSGAAPHGITINDIAPGAIATPINKRTLGDGELLHALQGVIPAGRLGEPDEVASVAVFLASDEAAYVTGSTYYIDGGMSHWNKGCRRRWRSWQN